jgi:hypothetical protein
LLTSVLFSGLVILGILVLSFGFAFNGNTMSNTK